MKISQKEKLMLVFLCVVMIVAGIYMLVIKPKTAEKVLLEENLGELNTKWSELIAPVDSAFIPGKSEYYYTMSPSTLDAEKDNLLYNNDYDLGNDITNLKGKAVELGSTSVIIPTQPEYLLFTHIYEQYFKNNILFDTFSITKVETTEYSIPDEDKIYNIDTSRITVESFECANNQTDRLYAMLSAMEKCGYIVVESVDYNPGEFTGAISIVVLMTPGDLSEYDVVLCPSCVKYIEGESTVCKYCGAVISTQE